MNQGFRGLLGIFWGILAAILSIAIILGSFNLAFAEGGLLVGMVKLPHPTMTLPPIQIPEIQLPPLTSTPDLQSHSLESNIPENLPSPPSACPPPPGWIPITIQPGDTLDSLSLTYNTTASELALANCLNSPRIFPGAYLYIPSPPPSETQMATSFPETCTPPEGWVTYRVRSGDTLFGLSLAFGVPVSNLQSANCMGSTTRLFTGQQLYVPNVPTRTPLPTQVLSPTQPSTSTLTATPPPPAPQPPATQAPDTATPIPSNTPTPLPTTTITPTTTATFTYTLTPSATATYTLTSTPSNTPSVTPSLTPTSTSPIPTVPPQETYQP